MNMLEEILGDFSTEESDNKTSLKPVTIWIPMEAKDGYDRLQKSSRRKFGKKAKELLLALIEAAEARTA